MNSETFIYALLGGLAISLLICVYTDLRYRKIYNVITLPIALGAPLFWFATGGYSLNEIGLHLLVAACAFIFCAIWFRIGWMGGGDLKLYCALSLWFSWTEVMRLFLYSALIGALLTLLFFIIHKMRRRKGLSLTPYGVAISLAGLWIAGEPYFNHFA